MRRIMWVLVVLCALALGACSGSDPEGSDTGGPGATAGTGGAPTGETTTGTTPEDGGSVGTGEPGASVTVSGDLEGTFNMDDVTNLITDPSFMAPFFLDTDTLSNLSIAGPTFTGTRETSGDLNVAINISEGVGPNDPTHGFTSTEGECDVTIDELTDDGGVVGSLECTGLTSSEGLTIDFSASFSA